jgi:hypothetical protein
MVAVDLCSADRFHDLLNNAAHFPGTNNTLTQQCINLARRGENTDGAG